MPPMSSPSELSENMPNASMMFSTYTPTFGNLGFQIMPSMTGQINMQNGTIPYMSLESLIYMQQVQAQTNNVNATGGQMTGQNNVQGSITLTDGTKNIRAVISAGGNNASKVAGSF